MVVAVKSVNSTRCPGFAMRVRHRPEQIFFALVLETVCVTTWKNVKQSRGIDFYNVWVVPKILEEDPSANIYSPVDRTLLGIELERESRESGSGRQQQAARVWRRLGTTGTPFLYTILAPLTSRDYDASYARFQILSLAVYVGCLCLLGALFGYRTAGLALILLVATGLFAPFASDVRVANVNRLYLAVPTFYLLIRGWPERKMRDLGSGLLLGLGLMFKPLAVFCVPLLVASAVLHRRWQRFIYEGIGLALGGALAVAVSAFYFDSLVTWLKWRGQLSGISTFLTTEKGNYGLAVLARSELGLEIGFTLPVLFLSAALSAFWLRRRYPNAGSASRSGEHWESDVLAVGMGLVVFVLASEVAWLHYYVLTLPLALFLLRPVSGTSREGRAHVVEFLALGAAMLLLTLDPISIMFNQSSSVVRAVLVSAGALILFALGWCRVAFPRRYLG